VNVFIFYLFALVATCLYLVLYGGRTGRWLAAIQFLMALTSAVVSYTAPDFVVLQPRMMAVDLISLALKLAVALKSKRHWPIWVAAFQLNTVLAETAILISPAFRSQFYYAMATIWAMPALLAMVVGVTLDRRREAVRRAAGTPPGGL
jgi:hypothetical protein